MALKKDWDKLECSCEKLSFKKSQGRKEHPNEIIRRKAN